MFNNLFKCRGWVVKKSKIVNSALYVELGIDARYQFFCPKCHTPMLSHSYRGVYIRDLPISTLPVHLHYRTIQGVCPQCGHFHTFRPGNVHTTMGFTWRFMKMISDLFRFVPSTRLSKMLGVSSSTIRRIDREVLSTTLPSLDLEPLNAILIDEKYLGASCGFVTLVINARTGEPVYMAAGKSQESLNGFFEQLSQSQREAINVVGIDRSNAYRAAVERYLPHASICFDHFHVISNLNEAVNQTRRQEMAQATEANRKLMVNSRFLLLRGQENLKEKATCHLNKLLLVNRNICAAYILKEQFREMYRENDVNGATLKFIEWQRLVYESGVVPLKKFAKNLSKSFNEVINFFRYRVTSGRIEAANASISRIQAKACGLFDIPYLFLKLRQAFFQQF